MILTFIYFSPGGQQWGEKTIRCKRIREDETATGTEGDEDGTTWPEQSQRSGKGSGH